jgi:hypothetical protein
MKELQEALDSKDTDRKKVLRRLKHTRDELALLSEQLEELQRRYARAGGGHDGDTPWGTTATGLGRTGIRSQRAGLHLSIAIATAALWWYYGQDAPAVHRKLAITVLSPVYIAYFRVVSGLGGNATQAAMMACTAWFLVGFVVAHKLSHMQYYLE